MTARFELTVALKVSNRRQSACEAMCLALSARAHVAMILRGHPSL